MSNVKKAISVGTVFSILFAGGVLLSGGPAWSAQQQPAPKSAVAPEAPLNEQELIKLIKHNKKHLETIAPTIQARGIDFELTPDIEKRLRKAGGSDAFIANLKNFTPSARASHSGGIRVSPEEAEAFNQLKAEKDPDKSIQEANTYAQNFPKSPLLAYVYAMEAGAYQQKNDAEGVAKYGQMSLAIDPNNLPSLLMVSSTLPQPQMLRVSDAEKEERLDKAESYAQKALEEIQKLPKTANETDDAYEKRKNQIASGAYASLGMVHLERSKMAIQEPDMEELGKAEESYKMAIQKSSRENPADHFRLGEIYSSEGKLDDAIAAFSKAAQLAPGSVIEQYANRRIAELKKHKESQAKAPAQP